MLTQDMHSASCRTGSSVCFCPGWEYLCPVGREAPSDGIHVYPALLYVILTVLVGGGAGLHPLTIRSGVRETGIVSLFIWQAGTSSKGVDLLETPLFCSEDMTVWIPSGRCNILAFDELGNSYGIQGWVQKSRPDTLEMDIQHITFGIPNFDHGPYLLRIMNERGNLPITSISVVSGSTKEEISASERIVFPGSGIILWLQKGEHYVRALDTAGREYRMNPISVPDGQNEFTIGYRDLLYPEEPIGAAGDGDIPLMIMNCLPYSPLQKLLIMDISGAAVLYVDSLGLEPGRTVLAMLSKGVYSVELTDSAGAAYGNAVTVEDGGVYMMRLDPDEIIPDFSFPD